MADLGSIGFRTQTNRYVLVMPELPLTAPFVPGRSTTLRAPRAVVVTTVVPIFGLRSVLCHTPGVLRFEHPVDAGKTVTVTIQARKNSLYKTTLGQMAGSIGFRRSSPGELLSLLPFLRITRADGLQATDIMADVNDAWDTLQAALAIVADGVLVIECVAFGALGDATLFVPTAQLDALVGPRNYWADLKAIAS